MNKKSLLAVAACSVMLAACGDEVSEINEIHQDGMAVLPKGEKLSKQACDTTNVGEMLFVMDSSAAFVCDGKSWQTLKGADGKDGKDGAEGEKGDKGAKGDKGDKGSKGESGDDGNDGKDGTSCTAKSVKNKAGLEGVELTCGETVIDTIWNGKDGQNGNNGTSCTAEPVKNAAGLKGLEVTCGETVVDTIWNGKDGENGNNGTNCTAQSVTNAAGLEGLELTCGETVVDTIRRVDVLGPCSADEENQIAMDSNGVLDISVTDMYVCHSGLWVAASRYYLDTRGWNDTTSGVIREGQWSAFTYKSKSSKCDAKASAYTYQPYTFDDKWRVADSLELCFGLSCTSNEVGKMYTWNSYSYLCNGIKWVATSLYQMGELHYLNSLKTYGTLHDARDGHDYKTIEIGDQVWMAENLNYADSIKSTSLQDGNSFCFGYKDTTCAIGGRIYYWASAMDLINTYNNKVAPAELVGAIEHRGLCPEGWHVPDSTEWITLYNSVSKKGSSLKGAGAWTFYADSIVADNASGFSAIPSGYGNTNGGIGVRFCSASQGYYSDEFRSFSLTNSSNNLLINSSDKDDGCFLRCVKNTLDVDVSSS